MTRMIERWFPTAEVSDATGAGWGSGNTERGLFTWFAARPTAQAKAAVITSLLPWPDDEKEQRRLQDLVRLAMRGRYDAWDAIRREIGNEWPGGPSILDPFSGRGMIPLEAARLGVSSDALEYSPVAVLASRLLTDLPFVDWSSEPSIPFGSAEQVVGHRLVLDTEVVLGEITRRHEEQMARFYPAVEGRQPWGYVWAVTLPCQECGRRFPLFGNSTLRTAATRKATRSRIATKDEGQSLHVEPCLEGTGFSVIVRNGPPTKPPTLASAVGADGKKIAGKSAICIFCSHVHPVEVHRRLSNDGLGEDYLLAVADFDEEWGKSFRLPTDVEQASVEAASAQLKLEPRFSPLMPAVPDEGIAPGNNNIVGSSIYGARTYGDLCVDRQTLSFVKLSRIVNDVSRELSDAGCSPRYVYALAGYATSTLVRQLRYSTRGAWLRAQAGGTVGVAGIFVNEGSLTYSYDNFEAGINGGAGSWRSSARQTIRALDALIPERTGVPTRVERGSAANLPYGSTSISAVVTDPPYDEMIAYGDSSDLFYAWIKRCMFVADPSIAVTADPFGAQEKTDEIIVKRARGLARRSDYVEHRTREHYDKLIASAFAEMRRVVDERGVVTIVFGHGEPEVWRRLLGAITHAELVLTGSWPARTESGGQQGKANIVSTLTMACRPAPSGRPSGRAAAVEAEVRREVKERIEYWSRAGLAPTDMLMASAGPAMEVVGRYSDVTNNKGVEVPHEYFLIVARKAVQEAEAIEVDHHPLDTFDARTRFSLWWVRLFGRGIAPKPELRWQALASDMELGDIRDLVPDIEKGCKFVASRDFRVRITAASGVVDVALGMASAWRQGLDAVAEVLVASGRDEDDGFLWAAIAFLADRLPDGDPDALAWSGMLRARKGVSSAARGVSRTQAVRERENQDATGRVALFEMETDE